MTLCGTMWPRDGGIDIACMREGKLHTLRFRCCLDSKRRVRLLGTGVVGSELVRSEVFRGRVQTVPKRHAAAVKRCVQKAWHILGDELRKYVARFPPGVRTMLDISNFVKKPRGKRSSKKHT